MFHLPMETLSHFIISSVLVFCNGLTPFYGYALRTFFTRKKGTRHAPCGISWEQRHLSLLNSKYWLSAPPMVHFTQKGAPYSLLTFQQ